MSVLFYFEQKKERDMNNFPSVKHFKPGDRLYVQAQQIWLILVSFVMNKGIELIPVINYGQLAVKMGFSDERAGHVLGRQLGIVGQFCVLNDLPPLNCIVVNKITRLPGDEVVLRAGKTIDEEQHAVYKINWYKLRVPTTVTFRTVWENYCK
jgi:hypothetical protein